MPETPAKTSDDPEGCAASPGSDFEWTPEMEAHYKAAFQAEARAWLKSGMLNGQTGIAIRTFAYCVCERMAGRDPIAPFLNPNAEL